MKSNRTKGLSFRRIVVAMVFASFAIMTGAQTSEPHFAEVNHPFPGVRDGSLAWADFDNDGDLDLLMMGGSISGSMAISFSRIYRNDHGVFTNTGIVLPAYRSSSADWADFDNDGFVDVVLTGLTDYDPSGTRVFRNFGGTNLVEFVRLPGVYGGRAAWGDFNQDGFPDLAITGAGVGTGSSVSRVFVNQRGTNFAQSAVLSPELFHGTVDWADYDGDGDLDLLLAGEAGGLGSTVRLYRNGGAVFSSTGELLNAYRVDGQWFDSNNDSWPDVVVSAHSRSNSFVFRNNLFRNYQPGVFDTTAILPMLGTVAVGDSDNDGFSDVLIAGYRYSAALGKFVYDLTSLYLNSQGSGWTENTNLFAGLNAAAAAWGDYDGDGRLDLMLHGQAGSNYCTYLYRNTTPRTNRPPQPPDGLQAIVNGNQVLLSWRPASDPDQAGGLTYNVRIGTVPGADDILNAMSALDGFRRVVKWGNAQGRTNLVVGSLLPGRTCYWSVQAVDNAFAGSAFAPEASFTPVEPEPPIITSQPQNLTAFIGGAATFNVAAFGFQPLDYQWQFKGVRLATQTNTTLLLTNVQLTNAGNYSVTVSNPFGSETSSNALLTVLVPPPTITTQPTSRIGYVGETKTFTVVANGIAPLSYQWQFNGAPLAGKTSSVLSLTSVQYSNAGPYTVVVSSAGGSITSSIAILTVNLPPDCTPPPAGLVSWWRAEMTANDDWDSNNGTAGFFLTTTSGKVGKAFSFGGRAGFILVNDSPSLRFTNAFTLEAWVNPRSGLSTGSQAIISKFDYPLSQPVGTQSAYLLGTTNNGLLFFTVSATGSARTNTTLVTSQALPNSQWSFVVATYDGAALRLYLNGTMAVQTNYSGGIFPGTANLGIGAIRSGTTAFWGFSGFLDEVSLYNRALTDSEILAIFNADVSGKCPVAPSIVTQPQDQVIPLGEDVRFTVSVLGSQPLKYQWRFNGTIIAGATNSALALEKVKTNQAGFYHVAVTNTVGFDISARAQLNLLPAPACTVVPTGLISWWPGDGNSADAMGTNNLTQFNAGYVTGKVDRAFNFNGDGGFASAPTSSSVNFGKDEDFTIEAWIKPRMPTTIDTNLVIVEKRQAFGITGIGYSLTVNQGRLACWLGTPTGNSLSLTNTSQFISNGPDLRDGIFHHVAVTLNRTTTNGGRLFVDGQEVLVFDPTPRRASLANTSPLVFGQSFPGPMDEPAIYNRALTSGEILAIRQAGAAGKCKVKPTILVQPVSQRLTIGSNVTFSIVAAGTPLLRYQWFLNQGSIFGATNFSYSFVVKGGGTFTVRANNVFGSITSSNAVLTVNNKPTIDAANVSTSEDVPAQVAIFADDRDNDPLTLAVVTPPTHGDISGSISNLIYTPAPNYFGPDSFAFKINDGIADSAPATVLITVRPVNDPPVAVARVFTLFRVSTNDTELKVIAPCNGQARVLFDASLSRDVDDDMLSFAWWEQGRTNAFGNTVVTTNLLRVGSHNIALHVSDGVVTVTNTFPLQIISASQAVRLLEDQIIASALNPKVRRPLITILESAAKAFAHGHEKSGVHHLELFQQKTSKSVTPTNGALAEQWTWIAQQIIDAFETRNGTSAGICRIEDRGHGRRCLCFDGVPGRHHIIEASTDLVHWQTIGVAVECASGRFEFEDFAAGKMPRRFYRLQLP